MLFFIFCAFQLQSFSIIQQLLVSLYIVRKMEKLYANEMQIMYVSHSFSGWSSFIREQSKYSHANLLFRFIIQCRPVSYGNAETCQVSRKEANLYISHFYNDHIYGCNKESGLNAVFLTRWQQKASRSNLK